MNVFLSRKHTVFGKKINDYKVKFIAFENDQFKTILIVIQFMLTIK